MWGTPMVGRIAARWRQAVADLAESRKLPQGCDATRGSHLQRSDERLQQTIRARMLLLLKRDARSRVGFAARAGGTQPCLVEIGYFLDGAMERGGRVLAHHPDGMLAGRGTGRNLKHPRKGRAKHRRSQAAAGEEHSRGATLFSLVGLSKGPVSVRTAEACVPFANRARKALAWYKLFLYLYWASTPGLPMNGDEGPASAARLRNPAKSRLAMGTTNRRGSDKGGAENSRNSKGRKMVQHVARNLRRPSNKVGPRNKLSSCSRNRVVGCPAREFCCCLLRGLSMQLPE